MARKLHISLTELKEYAGRIYCFRSSLERDCEDLRLAFRRLSDTIDDETAEAFGCCVCSIENTLQNSQAELDELLLLILKYAVMLKRLDGETNSKHLEWTPDKSKAFLMEFVMSIIMHAYITSAESEYMSVESYRREKKKSAVMIVNKVMTVLGGI